MSNEYFDKYCSSPIRRCCATSRPRCVPLVPAGIDALAGLELGGVPLATMMSQVTGLPARFVRKEAKTYGTCRLAEGGELDGHAALHHRRRRHVGRRDPRRRASSSRARGAVLGPVVCVIDRESGGVEKLAADGLELHALFTMSELRP